MSRPAAPTAIAAQAQPGSPPSSDPPPAAAALVVDEVVLLVDTWTCTLIEPVTEVVRCCVIVLVTAEVVTLGLSVVSELVVVAASAAPTAAAKPTRRAMPEAVRRDMVLKVMAGCRTRITLSG
jgi:hypothetical protein